jgi:hypothetical protein
MRPVHTGARPGLARLTAVELRKMADTSAGILLLIAVLAITVVVVVATCVTGHARQHTLLHVLRNAQQPSAILLPVAGVLLVTGEWSQRTALATFTLVPDRSRVIGAKLAASVVLSLAALVMCVTVSVIGTALASSGAHGAWTYSAGILGQDFVFLATAMITGVAFGAALLAPVAAIASYLGLPGAFSALGTIVSSHSFVRWIDGSRTLDPLTSHQLSGIQWGRALTTLAVWMVVPLVIGWWRVLRSEVK